MTQVVERVRYVSRLRVAMVHELTRNVNWRKGEGGQPECDQESLGLWVVRFADGTAMHLPERPVGFEAGKMVRITVEAESEVDT